jgi:hypothetical protein
LEISVLEMREEESVRLEEGGSKIFWQVEGKELWDVVESF